MSNYGEDIVSKPENYGLELVIQEDDPRASYSFDILAVLRNPLSGQLYYVQDSGCSCPVPFEDVNGIPDLTAFSTWDEIKTVTDQWLYGDDGENQLARQAVLKAVEPFLPEQ